MTIRSRLWDFTRGVAHRAFEPRVAAAQARLRQAAGDPVALATLGEWYAFRGMDHWAVEFLSRARERGAAVAPLTLARCYWNLNRNVEARREFQIALEQSRDPGEQTYLGWCIQAIDTEPERKRQQEAIAAAIAADAEMTGRANQAYSLVRAGKVPEAVAEVAELTKHPSLERQQVVLLRLRLFVGQLQDRRQEERVRRPGDGIAPQGREGGLE